ncbi:MAG TPA: NAD(P)H-dependent glycerol-3-phosphate dehydrogenase [Solirubrobacteraceae bacterium]|jgi:glycerol-3-phosphate dehydrogenase (NAD(P)+)|nr:NAD(P)H-dependent glycerol-3-phosphate dehydrogenase [Solirubrobacteraceae bacterium]
MSEPTPTPPPAPGTQATALRAPRARTLPTPGTKRATVIGAGSFGTALALLLARGGMRTTLQTRTEEQARMLREQRENRTYLPGVELPAGLRVEPASAGVARADYVFLAVPSQALGLLAAGLREAGLGRRAAVVSVAKGLVPPDGAPPSSVLGTAFGVERVACLGGPAHAQEMVHAGAGLVAAAHDEELARALAQMLTRAGVVCERSDDPLGVELAGAAKNAAALASGATVAQGLNAAGAAAGHIFAEVWRHAERLGARPESMIGLAGTGDLVATALAPESRNRRAGELLAAGVPAAEIPARIGQAVEALQSVPLLARALERGEDAGSAGAASERGARAAGRATSATVGARAPITSALGRLIAGELPLAEWVALVRATVPPPARWRRRPQPGFWRRLWRRALGA